MTYHRISANKEGFFKAQLPVDYLDTSLVQNTWETVSSDLSKGKPAKLLFIIIEQTNNGASGEDIELEITINGTPYTWTLTMSNGIKNYCYITKDLLTGDFATSSNTGIYSVGSVGFALETADPFVCSKVGLIRVRQTTDVDGTSAQIEVNIAWEKQVQT